ncbi:MAG: RHS repeat domain-containing protein, partial [Bacteroidota bacterium]
KLSNSRIEENYTYDSNKNMLSFLVKENDKPVLKTLYTYDNNNNLISVISTDGAGKLLDKRSYTYQYDENNNWTKKTVDIKGEPAFIVERAYTYY